MTKAKTPKANAEVTEEPKVVVKKASVPAETRFITSAGNKSRVKGLSM